MTILFDLDNTLIDRDAAYFNWLHSFFERLEVVATAEDWEAIEEKDNSGHFPRKDFYEWLIKEYQLKTDVHQLTLKSSQEIHKFLPQIKKEEKILIQKLKAKYQIGIVSNGGELNQMNKLNASGLISLFDASHIFISGSMGASKPDRAFFEAVENALNKPPHELMIVGDDFEKDIVGAKKSGWKTAWITANCSNKNEADFVMNHWTAIKHISRNR